MSFAIAASYWATYPISKCLRPRSAKPARSASIPCPPTSRFMKLNRQQTVMAECKAFSSQPAAKDRVGIGLRHACRRQRQLLHESENRPQLAVDGSGREILDQTVDRLRRDPEQFRRGAVAAVAILAKVERRHVRTDQLSLGWRERRRA